MRVLLDSCVSSSAAKDLVAEGHEVDHVGTWPKDPGDEQILAHARSTGAVLITIDNDFGELALLRRQAHCGIVRLVRLRAREQGPVAAMVLNVYGSELAEGAMITAEIGRVRIRPGFREQ